MARNKHPEETVKLILEQALQLFLEKGYENTSIQDIINNLGGLSKGAIYHHFKSKEEIFEAVCQKIGEENAVYFNRIRDDAAKTGFEQLKAMLQAAYLNPTNDVVIAMMNKIMSDPKFLTNQIFEIYELVAPQYVQPILEHGVADGSIVTQHPKELAEVLTTLLNIWLNPIIAKTTGEQMRKKLEFFDLLLRGVGLHLFDAEMIEQYVQLCQRYQPEKIE